eukprot:gene8263-11183_t
MKLSFGKSNNNPKSNNESNGNNGNGETKSDPNKVDPNSKESKRSRGAKKNPLLTAITDLYVDDSDLYKSRITRNERYEYFIQLQTNNQNRERKPPPDHQSWMSQEIATDNELLNYSYSYRILIYFFTSNKWDHLYINMFILWMLMLIAIVDKWTEKYLPLITPDFMVIPPIVMIISQIIPISGTIYFVCKGNDLARSIASVNFQDWAFSSALVAQYIEYFYFGGQDKRNEAGLLKNVKIKSIFEIIKDCLRRNAKIDIENPDDKNNNDDDDDENDDTKIEENKINNKADLENNNDFIHLPTVESKDETIPQMVDSIDMEEMKNTNNLNSFSMDSGISSPPQTNSDKYKNVTEWIDWKCITCGKDNHEPKHVIPENDVLFGEKGVFYKRTYAIIKPRRAVPHCPHCLTYCDYKPPLSSQHLFKHNPKPFDTFEEYPKAPPVQAGVKMDERSLYYNRIRSFFFGTHDDPKSAGVENDWRLQKYIINAMPEIPRCKLRKNEYYEVGEIVECKQQKIDWSRTRIMKVHYTTHQYDIKYDQGDELRFVNENLLRVRPEKRRYAYRVELFIRPANDTSVTNPSIFVTLQDYFSDLTNL